MGVDNRPCYGQTQTRTAVITVTRFFSAVEAGKNQFLFTGRHPFPGVPDIQSHFVIIRGRRQFNNTAFRTEINGIGQQVS